MKNSITFYTLLAFICLITSCKLDLFEDYSFITPEVTLNEIEQVGDTTFLAINVRDNGEAIDLIGVAHKIGKTVNITENQVFFDGGSGDLLLPMTDLNPEESYSFLVFVTNEYSMGISEPADFIIPKRAAQEVPCTLTPNTIELGSWEFEPYSIFGRELDGGKYKVVANSTQMDMDIEFRQAPTTGIYTTVGQEAFSIGRNEAQIEVNFGQWAIVNGGGSVYVEKKGPNQYSISFCDLIWRFSGNEADLKGNLIVE